MLGVRFLLVLLAICTIGIAVGLLDNLIDSLRTQRRMCETSSWEEVVLLASSMFRNIPHRHTRDYNLELTPHGALGRNIFDFALDSQPRNTGSAVPGPLVSPLGQHKNACISGNLLVFSLIQPLLLSWFNRFCTL